MIIKRKNGCFSEDRSLWLPGPPPTIWQALEWLLDAGCPGWRGKKKEEL